MMWNIMQNELFKIRKQKTLYVVAFIMLALVVVRVLSLSAEEGISLNGQSLPMVVVCMDITQYMPLFIVIFIANVFTEDYSAGTLKLSIIRPVTRLELLLGKFFAIAVLTLSINMFILISAYVIGTITGGWGSCFVIPSFLLESAGYSSQGEITVATITGILMTISSVILETFVQLGFAAVILLLALCINSIVGVIGIGLFIYAIFLVAMQILAKHNPIYLISSTYDICLLPLGILEINSVIIKLITAVAYLAVFLLASCTLFKKKELVA